MHASVGRFIFACNMIIMKLSSEPLLIRQRSIYIEEVFIPAPGSFLPQYINFNLGMDT